MTFEEILVRAHKVIDGKSDSYVQDARFFALIILRDYKSALENLTACKERMTELVEENRKLRTSRFVWFDEEEILKAQKKIMERLRERLLHDPNVRE